jgi:hypothetical protein
LNNILLIIIKNLKSDKLQVTSEKWQVTSDKLWTIHASVVKTIRLKFPEGYNDKFTLNVKDDKEIFMQIKK